MSTSPTVHEDESPPKASTEKDAASVGNPPRQDEQDLSVLASPSLPSVKSSEVILTPKSGTGKKVPLIARDDDDDDQDSQETVLVGSDADLADDADRWQAPPLPHPKQPSRCPLFCCFYAEFDNKLGPKVCFQSPKGFMEQEIELAPERVHEILAETFQDVLNEDGDKDNREKSESKNDHEAKDVIDAPSLRTVESTEERTALIRKNSGAIEPSTSAMSPHDKDTIFDSCSEYIITGNVIAGNIVNLSTHHIHVLTRPTSISDERYERNSLLFCVGFVLRRTEDPRPFRPVLSKLAVTLRDMEIESQYLSTPATRLRLQLHLEQILVSLNSSRWECNLQLNASNVLNLKLFHPPKVPALPVPEYAVPILLRRDRQVHMYDWDLAINWVSLHIDGVTNARQISRKAQVDMEMVVSCLRVLRHHGVVALVDIFFFTNRYESTSRATEMLAGKNPSLLQAAVDFAARRQPRASAHTSELSPSLHSISPVPADQASSGGGAGGARGGSDQQPTGSSPFAGPDGRDLFPGSYRMASLASNASHDFASSSPRRDLPDIKAAIGELYCACNRQVSIGELWINLISGQTPSSRSIDWRKMFHEIDHRRFTSFGLVHGLLRRIHNYPLVADSSHTERDARLLSSMDSDPQLSNPRERPRTNHRNHNPSPAEAQRAALKAVLLMDGHHCDDEIVCKVGKPLEEVFEMLEGRHIVSTYAPGMMYNN